MKPFDSAAAYEWATSRCALREYCRTDILRKLLEKGLPRPEADCLLDRLEAERYLDEARYAEAFVTDKTALDRWGRIKTRQALMMKGIDPAVIARALDTIDPDAYRATLRDLLREKARTLPATPPYQLRQKLIRYAAGRGFEADEVFGCLEGVETEE